MKLYILTLIILVCTSLNAKNESKNANLISYSKSTIDSRYSFNFVKLKYTTLYSKNLTFKYELKVPLSIGNMALLNKKKNKSRFEDSRTQFNSRFQNFDRLDLNSIVEKNKLYNISKNPVVIKSY